MRRTYRAGPRLVVGLTSIVIMVLLNGCAPLVPATTDNCISLSSADAFHARLRLECLKVGCAAMYRGSLSSPLVPRGIEPVFHPGRWDIVPWGLLPEPGRPASHILERKDILFSLQQVPSSFVKEKGAISLTVDGQRIAVIVEGVSRDWRFPETRTSVLDLLMACSDGPAHPKD